MKRKILMSVLVIFLLPVLCGYDSPPFDDKYDVYPDTPGFTHCRHPVTGEIVKDKFAMVVIDGENKKIYFFDCPKGTVFSCLKKYCVIPSSEDDCGCAW